MSKVSKDDINQIALLARLELENEEVEHLTKDMENILQYVDTLTEVDVEGVEPFINAAGEGNVFRQDNIIPSIPNEKALQNAPKKGDGFFKVPAVVK